MDKPRLIVRLTVALVAFVLGITSTLLVNYLWPGARQEVRYELRLESPHRAPRADAPCPYRDPTVQHAYVWTPAAPPPPEPPPPPPPPQRPRVRAAR
jgi:hypothetical protein